MTWQLHWPSWWHLYPYYTTHWEDYEGYGAVKTFIFSFGPLQIRGYLDHVAGPLS